MERIWTNSFSSSKVLYSLQKTPFFAHFLSSIIEKEAEKSPKYVKSNDHLKIILYEFPIFGVCLDIQGILSGIALGDIFNSI